MSELIEVHAFGTKKYRLHKGARILYKIATGDKDRMSQHMVEVFRDEGVKEYPYNAIARQVYLFRKVKRYVDEVWATVPDYPDDYHPRSLWLNGKTNIERTVENVVRATEEHPDVSWLIPIQGHNEDPLSVIKSIDYYEQLGITERYDYFAIANLCVSKRMNTIVRTVRTVYMYLPRRLHAFGISLAGAKKLRGVLYSFDSLAWTFPREHGHSCKNNRERVGYFHKYIERLP